MGKKTPNTIYCAVYYTCDFLGNHGMAELVMMAISSFLPSSASLRLSSSALAYAPKLGQRFCRGFPAVLPVAYSSDQVLVGQPLAFCRIDEARDPLCRMPSNVALIESEGELINVPTKMLWADMMEGAIDTAFEDGQTLSMLLVETPSRPNSPAL